MILRCMQKSADARYATAREILAEDPLRPWRQGGLRPAGPVALLWAQRVTISSRP